MNNLKNLIQQAEKNKVAIGHFNVSDSMALKAIFSAALELTNERKSTGMTDRKTRNQDDICDIRCRGTGIMLGHRMSGTSEVRELLCNNKIPIIIGTSEGEAEFLGMDLVSAMVRRLREDNNFPIFLNSDHTHTLDGVKKAVEAGYDAIIFDAGKLSLEENIKQTKEAVGYIKSKSENILVEGEIGYIGGSSQVLKSLPAGAAIRPEDLTSPEDAVRFVKETGVDLLAPAVGNLHGIVMGVGSDGKMQSINPKLDIERIKAIHDAVSVPLVLHGGSGISDEDFTAAINAGISIIHINTEIRLAWKNALEESLAQNKDEVAPYKILSPVVAEIKKVVYNRLKLFNKL